MEGNLFKFRRSRLLRTNGWSFTAESLGWDDCHEKVSKGLNALSSEDKKSLLPLVMTKSLSDCLLSCSASSLNFSLPTSERKRRGGGDGKSCEILPLLHCLGESFFFLESLSSLYFYLIGSFPSPTDIMLWLDCKLLLALSWALSGWLFDK